MWGRPPSAGAPNRCDSCRLGWSAVQPSEARQFLRWSGNFHGRLIFVHKRIASTPLIAFCAMHRLHDRVIPTLDKRMASQKSPSRHQTAAERSVALNRFRRVVRTGRHIAAGRRQRGRNPPLVSPEQPQHDKYHFSPNFFAIAAKARLTSSNRTGNSTVSTDFLGLMTTSTAVFSARRSKRTASRKRRLIRLRSTAPPSNRPTVKPKRTLPAARGK